MATTAKRPFGVTVLSILAWIAAVLAGVHVLQSLHLFPIVIGPFMVLSFSLWSALMWALMVWMWVWVALMLAHVDQQAWLFLAVITVFNLVVDFTYLVGKAEWSDISLNFILSGIILIYCMLPGVRKAFGVK